VQSPALTPEYLAALDGLGPCREYRRRFTPVRRACELELF